MKSSAALAESCAAWRHWTEQEGAAIETGDWARVTFCQREKQRLQPVLDAQIQRLRAQGGDASKAELQSHLSPLIALERGNQDRLFRQRALLSARYDELSHTSRNLRRLQASYAGARGSVWQSYS